MGQHYDRETAAQKMERLSMPIPECGCHVWLGKMGTGGYPYIAYMEGNKKIWKKAATAALELSGKARPEGLEVSHICGMEWCVNPTHLLYETRSENLKRRRSFSRYKGNVCKQGHPLPDIAMRNQNGSCPICYKAYQMAYRAKHQTRKERF